MCMRIASIIKEHLVKRVLITFAGGHHALAICQALKAAPEPIHIIGTDSSPYHLHQAIADELHMIPRADDPDYISVLSRVADETRADFVWPVHDAEIARITAAGSNATFRTWLPPKEIVETSRDKMATYRKLNAADVSVPRTVELNSPANLASAFKRFGGEVWVRAKHGASGKGAFRTSNMDHARYWLEINDGWGEFMCVEVLPGKVNYSWESIWRNGELVAAQTETEIIHDSPGMSISGVKSRGVQLRSAPPEVRVVAEMAVRALMPKPDAIFRVDLREGAYGMPGVTEIDAGRFGSGGTVDWHWSGYNWAYEALKLGMGEPISHKTPVIDPCPTDRVAIGGINRTKVFPRLEDIEASVEKYESRLSRLRRSDAASMGQEQQNVNDLSPVNSDA